MSAKVRRLRDRLADLDGLPDDERDDFEDMLDEAEDAESAGADITAGLARLGRSMDRAKARLAAATEGGPGPKPPARKTGGSSSAAGGGGQARQASKRSAWFGS